MILAEHREMTVIFHSGFCTDALGSFLLDHYRDGREMFGFQKLGQHRGGNVIRKIGAGGEGVTGQMLVEDGI